MTVGDYYFLFGFCYHVFMVFDTYLALRNYHFLGNILSYLLLGVWVAIHTVIIVASYFEKGSVTRSFIRTPWEDRVESYSRTFSHARTVAMHTDRFAHRFPLHWKSRTRTPGRPQPWPCEPEFARTP
jgi:hypothetical protein